MVWRTAALVAGLSNALIMHYRHKARKAITGYLERITNRTGLLLKVLPRKAADTVGIGYYDYLGTRPKNSH